MIRVCVLAAAVMMADAVAEDGFERRRARLLEVVSREQERSFFSAAARLALTHAVLHHLGTSGPSMVPGGMSIGTGEVMALITNAQTPQEGLYRLRVANAYGSVTSAVASRNGMRTWKRAVSPGS